MRYGGLLLLVFVICLAVRYAEWVGLAIAIAVLFLALRRCVRWLDQILDHRDGQREIQRWKRIAVARRADEQNELALAGDDRGIYGTYSPAIK